MEVKHVELKEDEGRVHISKVSIKALVTQVQYSGVAGSILRRQLYIYSGRGPFIAIVDQCALIVYV